MSLQQPPLPVEIDSWRGLVRFLYRGLKSWDAAHDAQFHRLVVLLAAGEFAAPGGIFWQLCPAGLEKNQSLIAQIAKMVVSINAELAVAAVPGQAIREREAIECFVRADADEDWPTLIALLPMFENSLHPPVLLVSLVQCLQRLDASRLAIASGTVKQMLPAIYLVLALLPNSRLELALNSSSTRVQFAGVFWVVKDPTVKLTPPGQNLLTKILTQIARNQSNWDAWMRAFNRFPSRYPELQAPLGDALTNASSDVIRSYLESQAMSFALDQARTAVSNCLRTFGAKASPAQRLLLWEPAFRRWEAWVTVAANANTELTAIAPCVLDYAVVGFIVEGMSPSAADAEKTKIAAAFEAAGLEWHASVTHFITKECRLLTRYQPFAHAEAHRATPGDFLATAKYSVIDRAKQPYFAAMLPSG
jgi:hypothetical protein